VLWHQWRPSRFFVCTYIHTQHVARSAVSIHGFYSHRDRRWRWKIGTEAEIHRAVEQRQWTQQYGLTSVLFPTYREAVEVLQECHQADPMPLRPPSRIKLRRTATGGEAPLCGATVKRTSKSTGGDGRWAVMLPDGTSAHHLYNLRAAREYLTITFPEFDVA
jgi:hypothetical protein